MFYYLILKIYLSFSDPEQRKTFIQFHKSLPDVRFNYFQTIIKYIHYFMIVDIYVCKKL